MRTEPGGEVTPVYSHTQRKKGGIILDIYTHLKQNNKY